METKQFDLDSANERLTKELQKIKGDYNSEESYKKELEEKFREKMEYKE